MARQGTTYFEQAPVTTAFVAVCIGMFILTAIQTQRMADAGIAAGKWYKINYEVLKGYGASWREGLWDNEWKRLVMPMFLHGGILHIFFNGFTLYSMGPRTERHYGSYNYGTILLLSGLGGICFSLLFGGGLSVGASGALFGLLGAELAVHVVGSWDLRRAMKNSDVRQTAFFVVFLFAVLLLVPNIDHWGHLGGLVTGFVYGALFEYWQKHARIGLGLIILALAFSAGLVVASRWMAFNPHYHVHAYLKADEAGDVTTAQRHYDEAVELGRYWKSVPATRELFIAYIAAQNVQDTATMRKLEPLILAVAPEE